MAPITQIKPWTHGIEIEQFPATTRGLPTRSYSGDAIGTPRGIPADVIRRSDIGGWHRDGSGPQETDIGPVVNCKTALNKFFRDTREKGLTWEWHAASPQGDGCGSHVHLCIDGEKIEDAGGDAIAAWTIAYNTTIELAPFLAPFWAHNWEEGFRDGGGSVTRWAAPLTTRASQTSVEALVDGRGGQPGAGSYPAVRASMPRRDGKPFTIEIRLNDAFPAMALTGILVLRYVIGSAIERGESPKLADRDMLSAVYDVIERDANGRGLFAAMRQELDTPLRFEDGRGIPGVEQLTFDRPVDVFQALMDHSRSSYGSWRRRCKDLARTCNDAYSPHKNMDALWRIDAPKGEFAWTHGPDAPDTSRGGPMDMVEVGEVYTERYTTDPVAARAAEVVRAMERAADVDAAAEDLIAEMEA